MERQTPASAIPASATPRLSVVLIVKNEARHIRDCLASVAFADEWIVVDSRSTDGTPELAAAAGARVIQTDDWPGFGPQKNRALAAATGDWVLSIDADERVTPELAQQIRAAIAQPAAEGYTVSRLSSMCGEWIRHGDWFPDDILRLFKRSAGRFSDDLVHERVICQGRIGKLDAHLLHESIPSYESLLQKMDRYSTDRAAQQHRAGKRGGLGTAIGHGLWAFIRSYVIRRGFLDGRMGFIVAFSIAEGTYYRYLKMWLLERSSTASSVGQPPSAP